MFVNRIIDAVMKQREFKVRNSAATGSCETAITK